MNRTGLTVLLAFGALVLPSTAAWGQAFDIPWYSIDGGGGTSSGSGFEVSGTIGQPDAGTLSGGGYVLQGGVWPVPEGNCSVAVGGCSDANGDGIRDDACAWYACDGGSCSATSKSTQADIGGANGACPTDGACDGNDNFHALNCFSDRDTFGNTGYPCEPEPPAAINVDAGGPNGSCVLDGVCDGNDNFHALNCFSNLDTLGNLGYPCGCTGPQPDAPAYWPFARASSGVTLRAPRTVRPGDVVEIDVRLDDALESLRGYQLHLGVSGGRSGALHLLDVSVHGERDDWAFADTPGVWQGFNRAIAQMVAGIYDSEGVPTRSGAYMATFTYSVSKDAAGTFVVDLLYDGESDIPEDRTFLFGKNARTIDVSTITPTAIHVEGSKVKRTSSR